MQESIKAIIVDDEEGARSVLSNLIIRFCKDIEIVTTCSNVEEAVEQVKKHQPHLVFLDIEMPKYAGYEIVNFFDEIEFEIIFTTAYDSYAIKAFEVSAVDYLLKPIDLDRLKEAVKKATDRIVLKNEHANYKLLSQTLETNEVKKIAVSSKGYQELIDVSSIVAIEAQESYSCIFCTDGKQHIISKNLKQVELMLADNREFFRCHKSWVVNKRYIKNYSKSNLEINLAGNIIAKLSKYRKTEFEEAMLQD